MRPELKKAVELLRLNTPQAVEEAIGLLQNTVYSFSMKVCGHSQDAEDTMQEVLYRSLGHLARIEDPQRLAVWLYTVTRNRCWRMRRKTAGAPAHMLSLDELMPSDEELGLLLQDAGNGPESNLLHAEQHHLLHQAILHIPAPLRIVLVLYDMEELTTEQVSQVLRTTAGNGQNSASSGAPECSQRNEPASQRQVRGRGQPASSDKRFQKGAIQKPSSR